MPSCALIIIRISYTVKYKVAITVSTIYFVSSTAMFVNENVLVDVATILGEDPAKIREMNLVKHGDVTHYRHVIGDDCVRRCWSECLKQSCYFDAKKEILKFNAENRWKKRGISINPTMFGIAFFENKFMNQAGTLFDNVVISILPK